MLHKHKIENKKLNIKFVISKIYLIDFRLTCRLSIRWTSLNNDDTGPKKSNSGIFNVINRNMKIWKCLLDYFHRLFAVPSLLTIVLFVWHICKFRAFTTSEYCYTRMSIYLCQYSTWRCIKIIKLIYFFFFK